MLLLIVTDADYSELAKIERIKTVHFRPANKKQTAVINARKYKRISGKNKGFILTFSYVATYIFRSSKPLNNNRNLSV